VARDGSIDGVLATLRSPRVSPALLGAPSMDDGSSHLPTRTLVSRVGIRGDTPILETEFETADGSAVVIDFMPLRDGKIEHRGARGRQAWARRDANADHPPLRLRRRSSRG